MTIDVTVRSLEVAVVEQDAVVAVTVTSPVVTVQAGNYFPAGGAGSAQPYEFSQVAPSTLWTVNHGLGYKPQVSILTSGGLEIEASITHVSVNQFTVGLNTSLAGLAIYF